MTLEEFITKITEKYTIEFLKPHYPDQYKICVRDFSGKEVNQLALTVDKLMLDRTNYNAWEHLYHKIDQALSNEHSPSQHP